MQDHVTSHPCSRAEASPLSALRQLSSRCRLRLAASLLVILCLTLLSTISPILPTLADPVTYQYIGCYRDEMASPSVRDLQGQLLLDEFHNSPAWCAAQCADPRRGGGKGFKYFGLQYGSECWCGNSYGRHGKAESEEKCQLTPCSGDRNQKCGGELANAVYEITSAPQPPPPKPADGRPLLALVMIVKDEAHTLPATLLAVKPFIDVYYILDTGSTDGTPDAIRRTFGEDVAGEVWEEPFIDYGTSRNRALEIAATSKTLGGPPIFSLMLSADETLWNGAALRTFCQQHRSATGPHEEAYYVQMDVGWRFDSSRLSRSEKGWRYVGRVHEYLAAPKDARPRGSIRHRVPETFIKFRVTDPERRGKREYIILKILQEEVTKNPKDTRSSFYLARTYNVIGNHSAALDEFRRRVSLGGWKEEVYESLYAIAWQLDALKRDWGEVQQAFFDAHIHSPERAEPLYAVANHHLKRNAHTLAYMVASFAATLPYPIHAALWVQADVYNWQCHWIVAQSAWHLGKWTEGARAILAIEKKKPLLDAKMKDIKQKYMNQLGATMMKNLQCEVDPDPTRCAGTEVAAVAGLSTTTTGSGNASPTSQQPPTTVYPRIVDHTTSTSPAASSHSSFLYTLLFLLVVSNCLLLFLLRRRSKSRIHSHAHPHSHSHSHSQHHASTSAYKPLPRTVASTLEGLGLTNSEKQV